MNRLVCALTGLLLLGTTAQAQTAPGTQPARLLGSVPFYELTGGVLLVQAQLDSFPDTLNFIFDTGSSGISLDSTTCAELGLATTPTDLSIRGIGGTSRVIYALNNRLHLNGVTADSLDFHISNYNFISAVYGIRVDGILGYSLLSRYILKVDYDSMKIFIFSPGSYRYERGGELLHPPIAGIPVVQGTLKNKRRYQTRYYFDMGAGLCLLFSQSFVDDSCLFCKRAQRRHRFVRTEAQGLMGKMYMTQTVVQEYRLGSYVFHNVPAYYFDDVSNVTSYPYLAGLVGNDLLRRFNVTLNYRAGEIYLRPNSHYYDPFDYSYTGLVMYKIDGDIQLTDVLPGTPAAQAGLQAGDILVAVAGDFSNNIQHYRDHLKTLGSRVQLIIRRNGKLLEKNIRVRSLL